MTPQPAPTQQPTLPPNLRLRLARDLIAAIPPQHISGTVVGVAALRVDVAGLGGQLAIGDRLLIKPPCPPPGSPAAAASLAPLLAEVVRADHGLLHLAPFGTTAGIKPGMRADVVMAAHLAPDITWLGRVLNPLGQPIDGGAPLLRGATPRPLRAAPPQATLRARLGPRLDLGVRALNCFATMRTGQRLGLFAASGIGKSTLLSMLARNAACDITVIALVGERGREVREFLEDDLGPEGRAQAITVVATSDAAPMLRREAAYTALTIAEHFRDQGKSVLLLMDSVTRFCAAWREIGLAAGEPPATRGYPPSVFAELPRLLERAGPGPILPDGRHGQITAVFTVLVDGDDHDEPIADAVRGILDGHIVLDRAIAQAGRYPAIDVLRSLSRAAASCLSRDDLIALRRARAILSLYSEMRDMVRLGAWKPGADPAVDEAVQLAPSIEAMLIQPPHETTSIEDSFAALNRALNTAA